MRVGRVLVFLLALLAAVLAKIPNPYKVLGVSQDASEEQIKAGFKKRSRKYHPDRNRDPGAETHFKEAAEAYEALSDPEKRQRYDRYGHAGLNGAGMHDFSGMGIDDIFSVFSDLFGGGFGGMGGRTRSARGAASSWPPGTSPTTPRCCRSTVPSSTTSGWSRSRSRLAVVTTPRSS